jgi:hypothetical protein
MMDMGILMREMDAKGREPWNIALRDKNAPDFKKFFDLELSDYWDCFGFIAAKFTDYLMENIRIPEDEAPIDTIKREYQSGAFEFLLELVDMQPVDL